MKKNKITVWAVLCMALAFTACTQDDTALPADTDNALASLPGNTPVQIITMLDGKETESRAEEDKTFAANEIHESGTMKASLYMVGQEGIQMTEAGAYKDENGRKIEPDFTASGENNSAYVPFDGISNMKNSSGGSLTLDDVPKDQWTVLVGEKQSTNSDVNLTDSIIGWSQLAIRKNNNQDIPVLVYNMNHTRAKVTLQLKHPNSNDLLCMCKGVEAAVWVKRTLTSVVPNGSSYDMAIYDRVENNEKSLGWCNLSVPVKADATALNAGYEETHDGKSDITQLTGLVYATATHMLENGTYSPTDGVFNVLAGEAQYEEDAFLSVEIDHGHDDLTHHPNYPHLDTANGEGGGYYTIKLSQVKMSDNSYLNKLEAGKHYIITLELEHNKLVSAFATIGRWDEYVGGTTLGDDSKEDSSVTGGINNQGGTI